MIFSKENRKKTLADFGAPQDMVHTGASNNNLPRMRSPLTFPHKSI
jgi:hypothetical protein